MPAQIPVKYSLLMLLGGLICAAGMVFLLTFLLSGPNLGPHYDFLLKIKKPPAVSREILIIDTDEYAEASDVFSVLMTLTEMDAAKLVMTGKVSHFSSPVTLTEDEIRRRFVEEYNVVGSNIRGLFEGIRMGSVSPVNAPSYVEQLVELTEQGRDRLLSALVERDENLIRAAYAFGSYLEADVEPLYDWGGVIRRVKLFESSLDQTQTARAHTALTAHPVYLDLISRYVTSQIENTKHRQVLWLRGYDGDDLNLPLDKGGNVITPWNCNFRKIDISLFREYEAADYSMLNALSTADDLGIFSKLLPAYTEFDISPLILGEHSFVLKEELLSAAQNSSNSNYENRTAWKVSRVNYYNSLYNFFKSSFFADIILEYEGLIADTDPSDEAKLNELIAMRNSLTEVFSLLRDEYKKLSNLRSRLETETMFSYCVMGPENNALYSALAANVLMTGAHIDYANDLQVIILSIAVSAAALLIVFLLRPVFLLFASILLSVVCSAVFAFGFVLNTYWIDPIIVLGSSFTGMLVLFYFKCAFLDYRARTFRAAYSAVVSKTFLQGLIERGKPLPAEVIVNYAAIIAIKETNLLGKEDREKTQDAGKVRSTFLSSVKNVLFNAGAVIVGFEGDTILACFGSPLEPYPQLATCKMTEDGSPLVKSYNPVDKAYALVTGLLEIENNTWRFGLDAGECTFYWSPETGYSVNGRPAVRARLLVSKTSRFKVRVLITEIIRKKMEIEGTQLGALYNKDDAFFSIS